MSSLFCCSAKKPYRPQRLSPEDKFRQFLEWAESSSPISTAGTTVPTELDVSAFVIQLVRQVNFGPLESKRYFVKTSNGSEEIGEKDLVAANYKKLNAFKNFKRAVHNRFFEVNVYEKDPYNNHHWRADIARPAAEIDL